MSGDHPLLERKLRKSGKSAMDSGVIRTNQVWPDGLWRASRASETSRTGFRERRSPGEDGRDGGMRRAAAADP